MPSSPPVERNIVSLDLSKSSTGYAVAQQVGPGGPARILSIGDIKPLRVARQPKWHFLAPTHLVAQLERGLEKYEWAHTGRFSLAIEAPIYRKTSSELQYYIYQEALHWAARVGVDVVTYANNTVKNFAKRWSSSTKWPERLEKSDMELIWRTELRPRNEAMFPFSILSSDDAIDAGWLSLLALYEQAHILPLSGDPAPSTPPLWEDEDPFRDAFLKQRMNTIEGLPAPDLSQEFVNARGRKHLGVGAVSFFPFRAMQRLKRHAIDAYGADPQRCVAHLLKRMGKAVTHKALVTGLSTGGFTFCLDRAGNLLMVADPSPSH